jgi:hypothetical protein
LNSVTLLGAFTSFIQWKTDHTVVFLCEDFEMTGAPDGEIAEARSFSLTALPDDLHPTHRRLLGKIQSGERIAVHGEW